MLDVERISFYALVGQLQISDNRQSGNALSENTFGASPHCESKDKLLQL